MPGSAGALSPSISKDVDSHRVALMLDQMDAIMVRSGQHCVHSWFNAHHIKGSVRASLYFYNTEEEAARFDRQPQQDHKGALDHVLHRRIRSSYRFWVFSAPPTGQLAKEAFDCVTRRVTFRPCTTGFDEKMKAKILGKVINYSEPVARFLNKYFEALAWVFFFLFLASGIYSVRGLYLFYTTGSCNGLNQAGFLRLRPHRRQQPDFHRRLELRPRSSDDQRPDVEGCGFEQLPGLEPGFEG